MEIMKWKIPLIKCSGKTLQKWPSHNPAALFTPHITLVLHLIGNVAPCTFNLLVKMALGHRMHRSGSYFPHLSNSNQKKPQPNKAQPTNAPAGRAVSTICTLRHFWSIRDQRACGNVSQNIYLNELMAASTRMTISTLQMGSSSQHWTGNLALHRRPNQVMMAQLREWINGGTQALSLLGAMLYSGFKSRKSRGEFGTRFATLDSSHPDLPHACPFPFEEASIYLFQFSIQ